MPAPDPNSPTSTSPTAQASTTAPSRDASKPAPRRGIGWLLAILLIAAMAVTPWAIAVLVSVNH